VQRRFPVDPLAIMTMISSGLQLIDQFRETAARFKGRELGPPGETIELAGDAMEHRVHGTVVERMTADDLQLDRWDAPRYEALQKSVLDQWKLFNKLFSQRVTLGASERAKVDLEMDDLQESLCTEFREMGTIYQQALGISLPDHYRLFEICGS
jgi:hypothetical protein